MKKTTLSLLVLLVCAAALAGVGWKKNGGLSAENRALKEKIADLERSLRDTREQSRTQAADLEREANANTLELMRLRNEVSQLRAQAGSSSELEAELARLRTENARLQTQQPATGNNTILAERQRFPAEQWQYAGLATPEAALRSALWELQQGQLGTGSALAATPDVFPNWQQQIAGATGVQILEKHPLNPGELRLQVYLEGVEEVKPVIVTQQGQNWQVKSFGQAFDPLEFYRQNPELMKRYFPHLVQDAQAPTGQ